MNELTEEEKMSVPNPFRNLTESQWKKNYNDYVSYLVTKELVIGLGYTKETNSWTVMKRRVHWFNSTIATGYDDIREKSFHS